MSARYAPSTVTTPCSDERYVPNVVYSCSALLHGENIILPYAVSDTSSRFAVVPLADVLNEMKKI